MSQFDSIRVHVEDVGRVGVNKDLPDYMLEPNVWTEAKNIRFYDGRAGASPSQESVFGAPTVAPYWLIHVRDVAGNSHWVYAGLTKVYTFASNTHTDITRVSGDYTATETGLWNGGTLGGIPILNNGADKPQMWAPISSGQKLIDLINWPAAHICKVLRPFKTVLFALAPTESGTLYPHRIRISHPASPGAVPSSWDEADVTKRAYVQDLGDTDAGFLLDAEPLGDLMVVYKERSTWGAQFIGGQSTWRVFPIFEQTGALADHCISSFQNERGRFHFVATGPDIIIHDGQTAISVVEAKVRRWLTKAIDTNNYARSFTVLREREKEVWFCFPFSGSTWPNLALVFNWVDGSITFRDLDQTSYIAPGRISRTGIPWDQLVGTWDQQVGSWDKFSGGAFTRGLLGAKPTATKLLHLDEIFNLDGAGYTARLERTGLDLIGVDRFGRVERDRFRRRLITAVYPEMSGGPVNISIGRTDNLAGGIEWGSPKLFIPGVDKRVDFEVETQTFGIRFESQVLNNPWTLRGYSVQVKDLGLSTE